MKMFFIVYAAYFDERITDTLKKAGYKAYTKMHDVTGEGEESEPKLDTHYSPGKNKTIWMAVEDKKASAMSGDISTPRLMGPGCMTMASGFASLMLRLFRQKC